MPKQHTESARLMRFSTFADQEYFAGEFANKYSFIVFNANMVAHAPGGLAAFVGGKLAGTKDFVIDPQTHAFQHDPVKLYVTDDETGKREIKASVKKLANAYGSPVSDQIGKKALLPGQFKDQSKLIDFCRRVLEFQDTCLDEKSREEDFKKYLGQLSSLKPKFLIAPYFYMNSTTINKWLEINVNLANASKGICGERKIFSQIVLDKEVLLDDSSLDEIIDSYTNCVSDGYLIWIDRFSETSASPSALNSFVKLISALASSSKPVFNLYGGYFSILLSKGFGRAKLTGVCHGLEHSEDRGVLPIGGGIPIAKFYFRRLHKRLKFADAVRLFGDKGWFSSREEYRRQICQCETCGEVIKSDPLKDFAKYGVSKPVTINRGGQVIRLNYPLPETKEISLRHYLHNKDFEFQEVVQSTHEDLLMELDRVESEFAEIMSLEEVAYASHWSSILRTALNRKEGESR